MNDIYRYCGVALDDAIFYIMYDYESVINLTRFYPHILLVAEHSYLQKGFITQQIDLLLRFIAQF